MDWKVATYVAYVAVSVLLTLWVGRTLYRNGGVFLDDVFEGKPELARSVNSLLVVGFYLVNFGFVSFALTVGYDVTTATASIEALSRKVGLVLVILGVLHGGNVLVLSRIRRRQAAGLRTAPPLPPTGWLPPPPYGPPGPGPHGPGSQGTPPHGPVPYGPAPQGPPPFGGAPRGPLPVYPAPVPQR